LGLLLATASGYGQQVSTLHNPLATLDAGVQSVAAGYGSVWAILDTSGPAWSRKWSLARIEPVTGKELARTPLPYGALGLQVGERAVWVLARGTMLRIDPQTNQTVATLPSGGPALYPPLAAGEGAVWVRTSNFLGTADSVCRVDPRTNQVVATIPTGHRVVALAAGEGAVWVLEGGGGVGAPSGREILRIDPATNRVVATIPIPPGAHALAVGYGLVWAAGCPNHLLPTDRSGPYVVRIDARTNQLVGGPIPLAKDVPVAMAVSPAGAWIVDRQLAFYGISFVSGGTGQVDRKPNQVRYRGDDLPFVQRVAFGEGAVWVGASVVPIASLRAMGTLHRLDP
jgi:DNA-binding beta-propeller fold protein YncE